MGITTVAVLIDLPPEHRYHRATVDAIGHAVSPGSAARVSVVTTDTIRGRAADVLGDAVVVGPGSPYRVAEEVHDVIRSARERGVPLIGT